MYFPSPDDVPVSPFPTPRSTNNFPRLTSLARNLLSDEGWGLPFHFRLGYATAATSVRPIPKTELLVRKRGKNSSRLVFSHTTPSRSRFVFGMNGVGQLEGELFGTFASSAAYEDAPASPTSLPGAEEEAPPHEEDGGGVRWGYDPSFEAAHTYPTTTYIDFFWERSCHISANKYLRGGFVIGGMLPASMLPFAFESSGMNLGATLQAVRGHWALGMDCQVRGMYLDLTGGRLQLNTVATYQKPSFSLTLNMHGLGDRFIASAVANPVGLYQALRRQANGNDEDLYGCTWLVGVEADTPQRYGLYRTQRLSFALTRRNTSPSPFPVPHQNEDEVFKVEEPLLRSGENKIKFDVINLGVGNNTYRLSVHNSSLVRLHRNVHVKLGTSLQADVLPFDPNTARVGLSLAFVA